MKPPASRITVFLLACSIPGSYVTYAQDVVDSPLPPEPAESSPLDFTFSTGLEYRDTSSLQDGGNLQSSMFHFDLGAKQQINSELSYEIKFAYGFEQYDFDGGSGFGLLSPWEDIQTLDLSLNFQYLAANDWILFGGPIFKIARESGSDWEDGFMGGGYLGATHVLHDRLILGAGLGGISLVEDDARIFPVIVVDWRITDNLRLHTTNSATRNGLELVYEGWSDWEAGVGIAVQFKRFRLDNTGVAPGGVGEENAIPFTFRLSYEPRADFHFEVYGGFFSDGEVEVDNAAGDPISVQNFGEQAFFGASVSIKF